MRNIIIRAIARVTGDTRISNDELVAKYKEVHNVPEDKASKVLKNTLGRDVRHVIGDSNVNTLTLGARAVDKLFSEIDINGNMVDGILYASQFPEYTCPTQSALIHNHIRGKKDCFTLDVNANCASGVYAMSVMRDMLVANTEMKYGLVVASDIMSTIYQEGCLVTEGCFGDAGVAVLLEVVESDEFFGLSRAKFATTDECINHVFFPECGNLNQHLYTGDATKMTWNNPNYPIATKYMGKNIIKLAEENGMGKDDIDWICCSQFTKNTGIEICEMSDLDTNKLVYVGDKYGYTGVSSPLMSYCDLLESGKLGKDYLIGITTIGLAGQTISMLYKNN